MPRPARDSAVSGPQQGTGLRRFATPRLPHLAFSKTPLHTDPNKKNWGNMLKPLTCVAALALSCPAWAGDHAKTLIDAPSNLNTANWSVSSAEWAKKDSPQWRLTLRTLHGGRQEGTQVLEVETGAIRFTIVPTRGFEVWKAEAAGTRLGWESPVKEIVHPAFVKLTDHGGLGWLNGFGGWMVRGGLASFGSPVMDGDQQLTLHGHVDYIPASHVSVRYEDGPAPRLVFRGIVNDTEMFGPQLRLTSEISVELGKPEIAFDDTITNLSDLPQEMQSLYHTNFGPPLLGAGAQFIAPVASVAPMDAASAANALDGWDHYSGPHGAGYAAQVFLLKLQADSRGETHAMLKAPDGAHGALMSFNIHELPVMSLWKNESSAKSGYVTGLEPGTSYPNPRPAERAAGRVPLLKGGEDYHIHLKIAALPDAKAVSDAEKSIHALAVRPPVIQKTP